jgi:hypothetical protein
MKRFGFLALIAAGLLISTLNAGEIHRRQVRQQKRIGQGAQSGQLTARETARLERKEVRLNRQIRRDRADGGGLSAKERARIDRKQDRLSREIYREKHDAQHR